MVDGCWLLTCFYTPHDDDALALLTFKSKADLSNKIFFSPNTSVGFCHWQGIKCAQQKVVRLVLKGLDLAGGILPLL